MPSANVDLKDDKEWAVRLFAHPFADPALCPAAGWASGIAGTYTDQVGTATAAAAVVPNAGAGDFFRYRAGSSPTLADGERTRLAPQFYYYVGSLGLLR